MPLSEENQRQQDASKPSNYHDHGCLPLELITDILLRLPVKSLGRFKSVCKSWNSLISTDNFAKSHHQFQVSASSNNPSALTSILLILQGEGCLFFHDLKQLNEFCLDSIIDAGLISPLKLDHPLHSSTIHPPLVLVSCNGLMCFVQTMERCSKPICVFNPTTKEFRYIPLSSAGCCQPTRQWASGFGFVPSLDDYKIVLLEQTVTFVSDDRICNNTVDVFSLRDDQWKELDSSSSNVDGSVGDSCIETRSPAVWSNEALYWVVPSFPFGTPGGFFILKFDLLKETFSRAATVEHNRDADHKNMRYIRRNLSIGVIAQKNVCVGQIHCTARGEQFFEMWMMEKHGQLNRLFILRLESNIHERYLRLLGFTPNGSVWLVSNASRKQQILLVDPSQNPPTYVLVSEKYVHHIMSYIPSLFSPYYARSAIE